MANKRKRSRKENRAIHAKKHKAKQFDIWKHQRDVGKTLKKVQRRNPKGHVWEGYSSEERKKSPKTGPFLPEF